MLVLQSAWHCMKKRAKNYMVSQTKGSFLSQHRVFLVLLLIGLLMRILFMEFQGLGNDELSAWYRTRYAMGDEFWKSAVSQGDMHPAFYQLMLWFWVRVFGDSEFSLRVPSLLFFVAILLLIYQIGRRFFSAFTGNLIVSFYVSLGFLIVHTTTARPYNSGVFFLLLAFYFILLLREKQATFGYGKAVLLGLAFLGAMTSHYFAFLSVGILGLAGLGYVGTSGRKFLFGAGFMALALFGFFHLPLTLEQFEKGGLGWLGTPSFWWFVDFTKQIFQNSLPMLLLGLALIYFTKKGTTQPNSHQGFSLLVLFFIAFVAYILSLVYTPILRELVFQFILPFAFFGFIGPLFLEVQHGFNDKLRSFMPFLVVAIFSMHSIFVYGVFEPIHYGVFKEIAENQKDVERKYGKERITYAQNTNNLAYLNYYLQDSTMQESIVDWAAPETLTQLNNRVKSARTPYFLYNWSNNYHSPMYLECIRREFPRLARKKIYFNSESHLYSRNLMDQSFDQRLIQDIDEGGLFEGDAFFISRVISVGELRAQRQAGEYFLLEAKGSVVGAKVFYLVVVAEDEKGATILQDNVPVMYWAYNQQALNPGAGMKEMFTAFSLPKSLKNTDQIKIYCWNPDKGTILLNNLKLYALK